MTKLCVVTGSRAEYDLLKPLMQGIKNDPKLSLQIIVTGMHLSPLFGHTYEAILTDGFFIDQKVEMLLDLDSDVGIAKSTAKGISGMADALEEVCPEAIIVLGDRFEIFAAVVAALFKKIPVIHLHGGELTEGSIDDAMRHSITKMSQLHFVANEEYRRRVIQMGETPNTVHSVGGLGVDVIRNTRLMNRSELEKSLELLLLPKNLLITFHPASLDLLSPIDQMSELLEALDSLTDTRLIFTLPNADKDGRRLIAMLEDFVAKRSSAIVFPSLGFQRYISCMYHCDGLVGNSSSGLLEAPTLKKGVVNIGNRQARRLQASNVINCVADREKIRAAINKLYSTNFQDSLINVRNPYGDGGATERILKIIKKTEFSGLSRKSFYDFSI